MNGTYVRTVLEAYSADKCQTQNVERISHFNMLSLRDVINYLDIVHNGKCLSSSKLKKAQGKSKANKLSKIICNRVRAYHQNECNICSQQYIPADERSQAGPLRCISCAIERHSCCSPVIPNTYHQWICKVCADQVSPPFSEFLLEPNGSANNSFKVDETVVAVLHWK